MKIPFRRSVTAWFFLVGSLAWGQSVDGRFQSGADSFVYTLANQPGEKLIVGGAFHHLADEPCEFLGRLNADGSLDRTYRPMLSGVVRCLAVQDDGRIVIGGQFTSVRGRACNRIARLNADGSLDPTFNSGLGANSSGAASCEVRSLAIQSDGKIVIGGDFDRVDTGERNGIARLNADGSLDAAFNPDARSEPLNPHAATGLNCVVVQADGGIIFGGYFKTVGGQKRNGIARVDADGGLDPNFNPAPNPGGCYALTLQADGRILIGGSFQRIGGMDRTNLARFNADGSPDPSLNVVINGPVNSIAVQHDGALLLGGLFNFVDRKPHVSFARVAADGTVDHSFAFDLTSAMANVFCVSVLLPGDDGTILIGGRFAAVAGAERTNLARIQAPWLAK